jgi:hypothetical protein
MVPDAAGRRQAQFARCGRCSPGVSRPMLLRVALVFYDRFFHLLESI